MDKILFVVILYNQKLSESNVYKSLLSNKEDSFDGIIVFDNSKYNQQKDIDTLKLNIIYIWNKGVNYYLSKNYNTASKYAIENDYNWLLLLDQDTIFPNDAISKYKSAISDYPNEKIFAPKHKIQNGRYLSPAKPLLPLKKVACEGSYNINKFIFINSGLLINISLFCSIDGYDEDINLDFSDFQFFEKAKKEIKSVFVLDIECHQNFSNENKDKSSLLHRYEIFCKNATNFKANNKIDRIEIFLLVIKHTLSLLVRCKSISVIKILINKYFKTV